MMMWNCEKKVEKNWATAEFPPGINFFQNLNSLNPMSIDGCRHSWNDINLKRISVIWT